MPAVCAKPANSEELIEILIVLPTPTKVFPTPIKLSVVNPVPIIVPED